MIRWLNIPASLHENSKTFNKVMLLAKNVRCERVSPSSVRCDLGWMELLTTLNIDAEQSKEEFTVFVTTTFSFQPAVKLLVKEHF